MLPPDHPLEPLQRLAAVASGRATLVLEHPSDDVLASALELIETRLGPLPHAELLEPWDDGAYQLRIDHDLELDDLLPLDTALATAGLPPLTAVICPPPEVRHCEDLGLRAHEELVSDGFVARMSFDAEDGGLVPERWIRGQLDDGLKELSAEVDAALSHEGLSFRSDQGVGLLDPGMDPVSGRLGVRLSLPPEVLGEHDGDALLARRQQVVDALARVVHDRAVHERLVLAPDATFHTRYGMDLTLWLVAPHGPVRPEGPMPEADTDLRWLAGVEGLLDTVELQLQADDEAVLAAAAELAALEAPVVGGPPRWWRTAEGLVQVGTWTASPDAELAPALAVLSRHGPARVVPGAPAGLAERWDRVGPTWVRHERGWWLRLRDGVSLDDWLAQVETRPGDSRDDRLEDALIDALSSTRGAVAVERWERRNLRPVVDGEGRAGVELRVARDRVFSPEAFEATLRALGRASGPATVGFFGEEGRELVARLWYPVAIGV